MYLEPVAPAEKTKNGRSPDRVLLGIRQRKSGGNVRAMDVVEGSQQ